LTVLAGRGEGEGRGEKKKEKKRADLDQSGFPGRLHTSPIGKERRRKKAERRQPLSKERRRKRVLTGDERRRNRDKYVGYRTISPL